MVPELQCGICKKNFDNLEVSPSQTALSGSNNSSLDEGFNDLLNIYQPAPPVVRSFWPRKMPFRDLSLNRKYVLVNLSSYPRMMLPESKDSAPPFVHSQSLVKNLLDRKFESDSLARCAGIVAMWSVKNKDNSVYIWRAIRSEQERIFQQCYDYDDWELVAALQAMCIYCILRILEKDETVTDFDIPLIVTMTKVARRVGAQPAIHIRSEKSLLPRWEQWIIGESVRRTVFIIFIISSLFDVSVGLDHQACGSAGYLAEMPLPSTKSMWNSSTEADWTQEYMLSPVQSDLDQLLLFRDLLSQPNYNDENNISEGGWMLDYWLTNVDEMGTLVVTAAKFSGNAFSN
ncbi:hypothetical protein UA08_06932 [Talaromyces atroroseus]|uniref:Transcription factor domain-containing protein n=1 Tax=Talaromyces atroroseus TaxID=1441469 RepID=A0A225AR97_TALAT|nr:hypothetical protein UA08_06932 [Talaromyces atroroseus]OKL57466.1 hypothetical protein UA08_06932 [Talaromyces atroroseus]